MCDRATSYTCRALADLFPNSTPSVDCCSRVKKKIKFSFRGWKRDKQRLQSCVTRTSAGLLSVWKHYRWRQVNARWHEAQSVSHLWILGLSFGSCLPRVPTKSQRKNKLWFGLFFLLSFCGFRVCFLFCFSKFLLSTTWPRVQWFKCKTGFSTTNISGGVGRLWWATGTTTRPGSSTRKPFKMLQVRRFPPRCWPRWKH